MSGRIELASGAALSVAADTVLKASAALADFPDESAFANINTPDDLAALQAIQ